MMHFLIIYTPFIFYNLHVNLYVVVVMLSLMTFRLTSCSHVLTAVEKILYLLHLSKSLKSIVRVHIQEVTTFF